MARSLIAQSLAVEFSVRFGAASLAFGALLSVCGVALAASSGEAERSLLLEIWVNGRTQHVVTSVIERSGALLITRGVLDEARIRSIPSESDATGLVDMTKLAGVAVEIDEHDQRLLLKVSDERLRPQIVDLRAADTVRPRATAGTGLIVDYDGVVTVDRGNAPFAGASVRVAGFAPWGVITMSGFGTAAAGANRFTRLDTTIEIDDPDRLRQWTFGDAISGGLNWSRPVRFAGLHIATDYSLRPEFVTQPLPRFFGQTAVPSTVDVFVDAAKMFETPIRAGPFEIRNLPVVSGGGTAQVVIRDELGRESTAIIPFYSTPRMLAPGLTAYSFDVGALRRSYGERSFDYGAPVAQTSFGYGLSDRVTLEVHAEAGKGTFVAGGGGVVSLPPFGVVQSSAAVSSSKRGDGYLFAAAAQSQTDPLNLIASFTATSRDYGDLGALYAAAPARQRFQVGANLSVGAHGALGISWIDVRSRDGGPTRLAAASYTVSRGGLFFGLTGIGDVTGRKASAEAFLSVPLGGRANLGASIRREANTMTNTLSLARAADPDGGLGYRLLGSTGGQDITEGEATWIGRQGRMDAGVSSVDGRLAARAGVSGALVLMDGALFATHTSDDAFALVRTGAPNVQIYRENRPIVRSDRAGRALVPDLNAYDNNHISIEPSDYPMATILATADHILVPRRRSGVDVEFSSPARHPASVEVRLENGDYPSVGARVMIDGVAEPFAIGRHGQMFIPDLAKPLTAKIALEQAWCYFRIEPPSPSGTDEIPQLGPLVCSVEGVHVP